MSEFYAGLSKEICVPRWKCGEKSEKSACREGAVRAYFNRSTGQPRQREIVAGIKSSNKTLTDVAGNLTKQPATKRQLRSRCE